jgi:hypothetical protein
VSDFHACTSSRHSALTAGASRNPRSDADRVGIASGFLHLAVQSADRLPPFLAGRITNRIFPGILAIRVIEIAHPAAAGDSGEAAQGLSHERRDGRIGAKNKGR